jgi:hypothetical protein
MKEETHMLHRVLTLLGLLLISPAHAALIEYSFNASALCVSPCQGALGIRTGDTITGGFLFDDAAPRTSYQEEQFPYHDYGGQNLVAVRSESTYDMGNLLLWVTVGDQVFSARGDELFIRDVTPQSIYITVPDFWRLSLQGDGQNVDGYTVESMVFQFSGADYHRDYLLSSELQVPTPFGSYPSSYFSMIYSDAAGQIGGVSGYAVSITPTATSVPEPGTLSLLATGVLGTLAARRRRHVAKDA